VEELLAEGDDFEVAKEFFAGETEVGETGVVSWELMVFEEGVWDGGFGCAEEFKVVEGWDAGDERFEVGGGEGFGVEVLEFGFEELDCVFVAAVFTSSRCSFATTAGFDLLNCRLFTAW
jgi:hypothetical protein